MRPALPIPPDYWSASARINRKRSHLPAWLGPQRIGNFVGVLDRIGSYRRRLFLTSAMAPDEPAQLRVELPQERLPRGCGFWTLSVWSGTRKQSASPCRGLRVGCDSLTSATAALTPLQSQPLRATRQRQDLPGAACDSADANPWRRTGRYRAVCLALFSAVGRQSAPCCVRAIRLLGEHPISPCFRVPRIPLGTYGSRFATVGSRELSPKVRKHRF
jgi:hypothetical protein